jgi:hypothetical protein
LFTFKRPMVVGFYQYSCRLEDAGCVGMAYYNLFVSEGAVLRLVMFPFGFLLACVALAKTVRALQQGRDI